VQVDDVGAIFYLSGSGPEAAAGFEYGEHLQLDFTFDDATPDERDDTGKAQYFDYSSTVSLTGLTSGATLTYFGGIDLELDDDEELEIDSVLDVATAESPRIIFGDIDFDTKGTALFTDVDDLPTVLSELNTVYDNNINEWASTYYWNGFSGRRTGMKFGPVPGSPTFSSAPVDVEPVPVPGAAVLALLGLGTARAKLRRRRDI